MIEDRPECDNQTGAALIAAMLLDSGRYIHAAALGLMIGAFALAIPAFGRFNLLAAALDGAAILFYFTGLYLAIRVAFDAAIFRALGQQTLDLGRLDRLLLDIKLLPAEKVGRDMDARIKGAMRLMTWQIRCLIAQMVMLASAVIVLFCSIGNLS